MFVGLSFCVRQGLGRIQRIVSQEAIWQPSLFIYQHQSTIDLRL